MVPSVRITLVASSLAEPGKDHLLTTFRIDGAIAIDSGSLGYAETPADQCRVRHLLLSHSHADHLASLPMFIENCFFAGGEQPAGGGNGPPQVYGHASVLECLRRDVFNDRIWPDYFRLAAIEGDFLRLEELTAERPIELEGLRITPVLVNHPVPTFGFVIEGSRGAAVIATDTGPTERLWAVASRCKNLRWVFLDAAFPEARRDLAEISGHMTPALFAAETAKLDRHGTGVGPRPRFVAVHVKAACRAEVERELTALGRPDIEIGVPGRIYEV
jgi:ribonuclease BN (tRNA processing enzyme)